MDISTSSLFQQNHGKKSSFISPDILSQLQGNGDPLEAQNQLQLPTNNSNINITRTKNNASTSSKDAAKVTAIDTGNKNEIIDKGGGGTDTTDISDISDIDSNSFVNDLQVLIDKKKSFDGKFLLLCEFWNKIFFHTFVFNQFYQKNVKLYNEKDSIFVENNHQEFIIYDLLWHAQKLKRDGWNGLLQSILSITTIVLDKNQEKNVQSFFKDNVSNTNSFIKLRRQIMIIYSFLDNFHQNNQNSNDNNDKDNNNGESIDDPSMISNNSNSNNNMSDKYNYNTMSIKMSDSNKLYYKVLISLFSIYYDKYRLMSPKLSFFNIHVSKSMGSSICETSKRSGLKRIEGSNCHVRPQGHPPPFGHDSKESCDFIKSNVNKLHLDIIAQENPLSGNLDSKLNIPKLCDDFDYILALRNPIERLFSNFREYCQLWFYPNELIHEIGNTQGLTLNKLQSEKKKKCASSMISLKGKTYGNWLTNTDTKGLITQLFANEAKYYSQEAKTIVDHSKFDATRCGKRPGSSNIGGTIKKTDDTVIFWYGGKEYGKFGLKTTLAMAKKGVNIRMYRGYSSNVYTRWLGFNYSTIVDIDSNNGNSVNRDVPFAALMAATYAIDSNMFNNAINLMFNIKYVLPFTTQHKNDNNNKNKKFDYISNINNGFAGMNKFVNDKDNMHLIWNFLLQRFQMRGKWRRQQRTIRSNKPRVNSNSNPKSNRRSNPRSNSPSGHHSVRVTSNRNRASANLPHNAVVRGSGGVHKAPWQDNNRNGQIGGHNVNINGGIGGGRSLLSQKSQNSSNSENKRFSGIERRNLYAQGSVKARQTPSRNVAHRGGASAGAGGGGGGGARARATKRGGNKGWSNMHGAKAKAAMSTYGMMDQMTDDEWKLLIKKNQFDLKLYELATWIADADIDFYQNYNITISIFYK